MKWALTYMSNLPIMFISQTEVSSIIWELTIYGMDVKQYLSVMQAHHHNLNDLSSRFG